MSDGIVSILVIVGAVLSAIGGTLTRCSNGADEKWYGMMAAVFFGLMTLALPLLVMLRRQKS